MKKLYTLLGLTLIFAIHYGQDIPNTGDPLSEHGAWGYDNTEETSPNNRNSYVIQRHYGLSFSAHSYYGGIRFYNQETSSPYGYNGTMVMSITNNKVGVGTTSPIQLFNVHGTSGIPATSGTVQNGIAAFSSNSTYSTLYIGNYPSSPWGMWLQASARHGLNGNHPIIFNPNGGKVGIGVVSPDETLHVNGTMTITGDIGTVIDGNHWETGKHTLELQNNDAGDVVLAFHRAGYTIASIRHSSLGGLIFSGSGAYNSNHMYVKSNGNVGIGTDNPKAKLSVNGTVISSEIKVLADISQYPDFVFSQDYNLRSLKEVEKYIEDNKHLPEIPKADEVKDGIALGDMNYKLLQKIEELTLYMIDLNNKVEVLQKENEVLKQKINLE